MNAEQKQLAERLVRLAAIGKDLDWLAREMAALLQELVDAPEPEPFGYFKSEPFGWTDCAETDDGAIALYTAPPAPSVPDGQLQAAFDRGLKAGNDQSIAQQIEIHKLHGLLAAAPPPPSVLELEEYDAGALNDFGGGNVGWWQDYIRSELGRAYEFYCGQLSAAPTTAEAPSVSDGWRSAIAKEFPLYDEDGIDNDKHCCEWVMLQERKRLHKILAAPTPTEPPADLARDAERFLAIFDEALKIGSGKIVDAMMDYEKSVPRVDRTLDGYRKVIDAAIERDKLKGQS